MTNNQRKIELTDRQWLKIEPLFPKQVTGRPAKSNRLMLEAMIFIGRTGTPWRDLDREYGPWQTCYSRFRKWTKIGLFEEIYQVLTASDFDWENVSIDSTTIKVHQHAANPDSKKKSMPWGAALTDYQPKFTS